MKKQIIQILLFIFTTICAINQYVYAASNYTVSTSEHGEGATSSGGSTCKSTQRYYQGLKLNNVKVKFTQDSKEYFFDITAESSFSFFGNTQLSNYLCQANYNDIPQPVLYNLEDFGDGMTIEENSRIGFVDYYGNTYSNSAVTIKNKEIGYLYSSAEVNPSTIVSTGYTKRDNGEKFFIPNEARIDALADTYNYKNVKEYPFDIDNNGEGVRMISNASSKSFTFKLYNYNGNGEQEYIDNANIAIKVKLAIDKSYIDDYRYVCFICSEMGHTSVWQKNNSYLSSGYSLSTNTIDLKSFSTCNHSWAVTESDATNHTIKCANCEWKKTEAHDFKFEYDGILNDVCVCSRVKQVKYHYEINDDYNVNVDKALNANSICEKVEVKKKTGYNFKWYEKYELQFNGEDLFNMTSNKISTTKVFLNNTTSIDSTTGSRSIFYKAVYSPIKYVFNYSSKASTKDYISKSLNKSIGSQMFYYDSKEYLKDNCKYDYLRFKGWTLTEGSSDVDFLPKAEILNYTSNDLSEFTIYPIYEPMEYKILYNTISGKYEGDTQQISKTYDYYIDEDFVKPKDMGKNKIFSHYEDMKGNEFTDMNALRNFIKDGAGEEQTIILFAMSKTVDVGDNSNESGNTTPQDYWDLNNKDDLKEDITDKDNNTSDGKTNDNSRDDAANNIKNDLSNDRKNDIASDNSNENDEYSFNNAESTTNTNNNNSTNMTEDSKVSNSLNNNNDNSIVSYRSYSSGGGGGSNSGSEKIKSFPEDKYTGPGVVNSLSGNVNAEEKNSIPLINNSLYLYNDLEQDKVNKKNTKDKDVNKEENTKEEEISEEIFGPPIVDFENSINYRGVHGPWYYEKEYVDRILREKDGKAKKFEEAEEFKKKKEQKESNSKFAITLVLGILFLILIVLFEIFNIIQMRKNKKSIEKDN